MLEFTSRSCGDSVHFYALYPAGIFSQVSCSYLYHEADFMAPGAASMRQFLAMKGFDLSKFGVVRVVSLFSNAEQKF